MILADVGELGKGYMVFPGGTVVKNPPVNAGDTEDARSILGSGRAPGGGQGNPLHYSCLDNYKDRRDWCATDHGVANSQTWLRDCAHSYTCINKGDKRQLLFNSRMPTNKCERNGGNRKLPFGKHHSNNCYRHESWVNDKISGQSIIRNRMLHGLKVSSHEKFINCKRKTVTLWWRNL